MDTGWIEKLRILGEIPACGFYQAIREKQPSPVPFGRALRSLYENMEIRTFPVRWMWPSEPLPNALNAETDRTWYATSFIGNLNHHAGFCFGGDEIVRRKKLEHPELAAQRHPELYSDLLVRIGGYSEYFTRLDPALQQTVIDRSEYV